MFAYSIGYILAHVRSNISDRRNEPNRKKIKLAIPIVRKSSNVVQLCIRKNGCRILRCPTQSHGNDNTIQRFVIVIDSTKSKQGCETHVTCGLEELQPQHEKKEK
ncbi:hypothetical protein BLOT_014512 [Blomia tropicalis]|nr:hypothetical protein BLOT_014512 [Blomia tropicalis]